MPMGMKTPDAICASRFAGCVNSCSPTFEQFVIYNSDACLYYSLQEVNTEGDELLVDGDMEAAGVTDWSALSSTLSKETGARTGGSGTRVLRILSTSTFGRAYQSVLTIGNSYRVIGWARSDGIGTPSVRDGIVVLWNGTNSTSWQQFDIEFVATDTQLRIMTVEDVQYTEWDEISVVELIPDSGYGVVEAWNPGDELGRDLLEPDTDFTSGWVAIGASVVDDSDSYTSTGLGGPHKILSSVPIGKTFSMRFKGTTTATNVLIQSFDGTVTYKTITGGGAFDETFDVPATAKTSILIRNIDAGTTDIDWTVSYIKQTDIAPSSDFLGAEVLDDGDMEAVGVADWTAVNGILTKETGTRTGGSGTQILRLTAIAANPQAKQIVLTVGKVYRVTGWVRSDGNSIPRFVVSAQFWIGTNSTSWQPFDFEFTADGTIAIFQALTSVVGEYAEWDDISVKPANPLNALNEGSLIGQDIGIWNLLLSYCLDGAFDYIDMLESPEFNSIFSQSAGAFVIQADVESGVWIDNTERYLLYLYSDANNYIALYKNTSNQIVAEYMAGGTLETLIATHTSLEIIQYAISWDADNNFTLNISGVDIGTVSIGDVWVGNLTLALLGAKSKTPTSVWYGCMAHAVFFCNTKYEPFLYDMNRYAGGLAAAAVAVDTFPFDDGFDGGFE